MQLKRKPIGATLAAFQLTTQDHGTEGAGFTADSTTINFSGLFSLNKDGGSDGAAHVDVEGGGGQACSWFIRKK